MSDITDFDVLAALHPQYANVVQSTNSATLSAATGLSQLAQVLKASQMPTPMEANTPVGVPSPGVQNHLYIQGWRP
ncbi:MAG: hypothetical protein P4M15_08680 [Alphaproteobacteria bacterium]|nr:hypothetical protein [Alphaproteobacteria bacterium]